MRFTLPLKFFYFADDKNFKVLKRNSLEVCDFKDKIDLLHNKNPNCVQVGYNLLIYQW